MNRRHGVKFIAEVPKNAHAACFMDRIFLAADDMHPMVWDERTGKFTKLKIGEQTCQ